MLWSEVCLPKKIADALDVDVSLIHKKVGLLNGVCPEVVELLRDQNFSSNVVSVLRKLKPDPAGRVRRVDAKRQ